MRLKVVSFKNNHIYSKSKQICCNVGFKTELMKGVAEKRVERGVV